MFQPPRIYLASKSPRRRELLQRVGVHFEVMLLREQPGRGQDIDERVREGESPDTYVLRIAGAKVDAGWQRILQRHLPLHPVLAADTTVCVDGRIFGKPVDRAEAILMLHELSGREHEVLTGIAVRFNQRTLTALTRSIVRFRTLTEREIEAYVASGEPMDKAGAYAVQGFAQAFIPEIRGSYSGIVGLPLCETIDLLRQIAA